MVRRACIAVGLWLSCCGCLAVANSPEIWIDVPFVQQQRDGCGPASIAMVMQYWQRQHAPAPDSNAEYGHIQSALLTPAVHGTYASAMVRYFQQNGFSAFTFTGDWDLVEHHLAQGRPLIVALEPSPHSPLHYVVVVGVDQKSRLVFVNDPAERKLLKEDSGRFDLEWKAAAHWTLLAVPGANTQ